MTKAAAGESSEEQSWHALHADEALAALATDAASGLTREEAAARRERFGDNALPEAPTRSALAVFLGQFRSPLIYLLLGAAALALALGERSDAAVIFAVVLLNALIGAVQEGRAQRALVALRHMAGRKAQVVREGREEILDAREVVPGDILVLAAGDAVGADARLVEGAALQIAEAALTGESLPVAKDLLPVGAETPLSDRRNMVYAGTHVTAGRAHAVVVATGLATEIGRIAALAEAGETPKTPLERRVDEFGRWVMVGAGVLFVLIVAVGLLRELPLGHLLMLGVSQVVGLIPEGLPVAMTIALAVGVQRMARRGAIVRRLAAVETLGSTTVICSDKTGTLTRNEMTVTAVLLPGRSEIAVSGGGYSPEGAFAEGERGLTVESEPALRALLEAAVLCNDSHVLGPDQADDRWRAVGDPTEAALVTFGIKGGLRPEDLRALHPRRAEIPFDAGAKLMATEHEGPGGDWVALKGAPEELLSLCGSVLEGEAVVPMDPERHEAARDAASDMASRALRVLAIGRVPSGKIDGSVGFPAFRGQVTLLGLVGQMDPPRPEVKVAVARCRDAGIRPVMVTGDHKATGLAVARALDIARDGDLALDGTELAALSDEALTKQLARVSVFARVHPAQKLRIVRAYQSAGEVVAMTGDGVNDAPALVRADVGVAMGVTGTEVAKEAAEIVLTDDNFTTIVAAVEEGRVVYRNIKKAVLFLFATSLAEVLVLLLAVLLGYPAPFAAVQILWNNLVTEGVITINLILEPAEGDEMRAKPTSSGDPLLDRALLHRLLFMTPVIVACTLGWFTFRISSGVPVALAQSETFTLLVVCEWFNVLNCRSERRSAFSLSVLKNRWLIAGLVAGNILQVAVIFWPPMNRIFHTVPFGLAEVITLGVVGSGVLWVEEARKLWVRFRDR